MGPALALAMAAALGADLRVEGGIRSDGRSRTYDPEGEERVTTAEVAISPRAALQLVFPDLEVRASYAPTFRAPDVLTSTDPDVLHAAELQARLRLHPVWSLTGVAAARRGTTDLLAESRLRPTAPDAVPTTRTLRYVAASADVTLHGTTDPRTSVTLTAGWFAGGGDDEASRQTLPFERGLRATGGVEWSATRRDVVSALGNVVAARFDEIEGGEAPAPRREAALATLTAGWRRQITRFVAARARAGATATFDNVPEDGEPPRRSVLPAGEVGLSHASERLHLAEEVVVRAGSSLDRVRGTADRTYEAEASARWAPAPAWSFAARAAAALVQQDAPEGEAGHRYSRRGSFELRGDWAASRRATLGLGVYGHVQRTPDPNLPSFVEYGAFGSVAFDLRRGG